MKVRFTPRSLADLEAIHAFLVSKNPGAAVRVRNAIEQAVRRPGDFPHSGPPTDEEDLRLMVVQGFPYRVFTVSKSRSC